MKLPLSFYRPLVSIGLLFSCLFSHSAWGGTPLGAPQRFEAEDATLLGTVVSSAVDGFSGTGYVRGFSDGEDRVVFDFPATQGVYELTIGFRTPGGRKGFGAALNGLGFSGMFEAFSDWQRFEVGTVLLEDGANEVWVGGGWSYYEIDYIELLEVEYEAPEPPLPVDPTPVDDLASQEVKDLLVYLSDRYGLLTLSGQQDVVELDVVEDLTGVRPAILGGDLINYSPTRVENGANTNNETEELIAHHEAGMIITVAWHWNAPTDLVESEEYPWWRGFYTNGTTFDFEAALNDPEGDNYALILRDIDAIAVELKKLQAANVPVLWRPLHESDGGWFWWGTKGADNLRRLWVLLYERLTNHHGIHNLIWVQTIEDLEWYAGDEYVDILGVDAYPDDSRDPQRRIWAEFLERFNGSKMIALSEFGRVPDVPSMHIWGVWFSYFMSWNGDLGAGGMPDVAALQDIYTSDAVVTLDELSAVDADGDGLDRVLETAYGSSDDLGDSNDDGVGDGVSVEMGYNPLTDLSGMLAFYVAEERAVELWSSSGDLLFVIPIGLRTDLSDLATLQVEFDESGDLKTWIPVDIGPELFVDRGNGVAVVKLVGEGDQRFVQVTAKQR